MISEMQFAEKLREYILSHYKYDERRLQINETPNNGTDVTSLVLVYKSNNPGGVGACFGVEIKDYYKKYLYGVAICNLAYEINNKLGNEDNGAYMDKLILDGFKGGKVVFKLVNKARNRQRVEEQDILNAIFMDFYMIFEVFLEGEEREDSYIEITRDMAEKLGADVGRLLQMACKYTKETADFKVAKIASVLATDSSDEELGNLLMNEAVGLSNEEVSYGIDMLNIIVTARDSETIADFLRALMKIYDVPDDFTDWNRRDFDKILDLLGVPDIDGIKRVVESKEFNQKMEVSVLRALFGIIYDSKVPMYVILSNVFPYGSSGVFYGEYLRQIADRLRCDELLLLPSSTNEFLVVRREDWQEPDRVVKLIQEMNDNLEPYQILGDRAYIYKVGSGEYVPFTAE